LPVPLDALGRSFRYEYVSRRELVDTAQRGPVARNVLQRQVRVDGVEVDLSGELR
jgi:hypothetical protein